MTSAPEKCRAAVLSKAGGPLEVLEVQVPDRMEPGSVLVQTNSATICATDVHMWEGVQATLASAKFPIILGHEMSGRVVRFGDGPREDSIGQPLAEGDRVIWTHGFCGRCINCVVEHNPTLCEHRRGYMSECCTQYPYLTGGFSEYGYVYPTSGRVRVPDELSDEIAAAASCSMRTVVQGFDRLGPLDDRHTVVIQGSGPLGLFSLAKAVTSGPHQVIVVGGPEARLALARRWGASETIDVTEVPDPADRQARVMELTAGRGADVVIEMSGIPAAFAEGMGLLRSGGRYLLVGQVHSKALEFNASNIVFKHATLIGSLSASVEHYYRGLEFLRHNRHRFAWDELISGHYPLEDINSAFAKMAAWQEIKPAITFA